MSTCSYTFNDTNITPPDFKVIRTSPSPFVSKLYRMVNDKNVDDYISWEPKGKRIIIKNRIDFSEKVLPCYYRHCNWTSFVRQLNLYGFSTEQHYSHEDEYEEEEPAREKPIYIICHPDFEKENDKTLSKIKRNNTQSPLSPPQQPTQTKRKLDQQEERTVDQLNATIMDLQNRLQGINNETEYLQYIIDKQSHMIKDLSSTISFIECNSDKLFQEIPKKPTRIQDLIEQVDDDESSHKRPRHHLEASNTATDHTI